MARHYRSTGVNRVEMSLFSSMSYIRRQQEKDVQPSSASATSSPKMAINASIIET